MVHFFLRASWTCLATILLFVLMFSLQQTQADSNGLRGGGDGELSSSWLSISSISSFESSQGMESSHFVGRGIHRVLYGLQQGMEGFNQILSGDFTFGVPHDMTTPDRDPNFIGREVSIENAAPSTTRGRGDRGNGSGAGTGGTNKRIVGGEGTERPVPAFSLHLREESISESWHMGGCGGALISNCHVLTAAHCSTGERQGLPHGVYVGAWRPYNGNGGEPFHFSRAAQTILHPEFDDSNNHNDVALILMENCVDLDQRQHMNIADPNFMQTLDAGDDAIVMGFGRLEEDDESVVSTLNEVAVPYIPHEVCRNVYYGNRVHDDMICAGRSQGGKDSCQGDSGGPLVVYPGGDRTSLPTIIGTVSWGTGCAQPNKPGVYSSMAHHYCYIRNTVCGHSETDQSIELCQGYDPNNTADSCYVPSPPSLSPTSAPSQQCRAPDEPCGSSLDCCGALDCHARDRVCKTPSSLGGGSAGNGSKNSLSQQRRSSGGGERGRY